MTTKRRLTMKTIIIAAAAFSSLFATAAFADTVKVSAAVVTHDLNLSTPHGAKTLALRIHRAASQLCNEESNSVFSEARKAYRACYKSATESTVAAVQARTSVTLAAR
jgi:UrcA family protein